MLAGLTIQPPLKPSGSGSMASQRTTPAFARWNHLDAIPIKRIHDRWISAYATHALSILDRLKADLEE
jgi:hypothetical protein